MSSFQMVDMSAIRLQLKEQADEIERLRKALRDIDKHLTGDLSKPVIAVSLPLIRSIARAALGEKA